MAQQEATRSTIQMIAHVLEGINTLTSAIMLNFSDTCDLHAFALHYRVHKTDTILTLLMQVFNNGISVNGCLVPSKYAGSLVGCPQASERFTPCCAYSGRCLSGGYERCDNTTGSQGKHRSVRYVRFVQARVCGFGVPIHAIPMHGFPRRKSILARNPRPSCRSCRTSHASCRETYDNCTFCHVQTC